MKYIKKSHIKPKKIIIAVIILMVVLVFSGLMILDQIAWHNGYVLDPTDNYNFHDVIVNNDLSESVHVKWVNLCKGPDMDKCNQEWDIPSGKQIRSNHPRQGGPDQYEVYNSKKNKLGCMIINSDEGMSHGIVTLYTSQATKCK